MSDYFHFKQFSVCHKRSAMKVGTDAVLLGAWTDVTGASRVLDIGCGTGLLALMVAQRTTPSVIIDAVELDALACEDALENFRNSPWSDRLFLHHVNIGDYMPTHQADLIICNPPYFNNSLRPPYEGRTMARHTETLPHSLLAEVITRHLSINGRASIILPPKEAAIFENFIPRIAFYKARECSFRTRASKKAERILLEFSRKRTRCRKEEIILYENQDNWSEAYTRLVKDFYLKV